MILLQRRRAIVNTRLVTRVTIGVALTTFRLLSRTGRLVSLSCISRSVRSASLALQYWRARLLYVLIRIIGNTRAEDVAQ